MYNWIKMDKWPTYCLQNYYGLVCDKTTSAVILYIYIISLHHILYLHYIKLIDLFYL